MFHSRCWQIAADKLAAQGIQLVFSPQSQALKQLAAGGWDLLLAELSVGQADFAAIIKATDNIAHRLGLSSEIPAEFTTFNRKAAGAFREFTRVMSTDNYAGALLNLLREAGFAAPFQPFIEIRTTGIWHPEAPDSFPNPAAYLSWRAKKRLPTAPIAAPLFYYGQLVEDNLTELRLLVNQLEKNNLCPMPVFSPGVDDDQRRPAWFELLCRTPNLHAVINFMAGRLFRTKAGARFLAELDVPVLQALRAHSQTPEQWLADPAGLPPMGAVFSQSYPEMFGTIQPTMTAGTEGDPKRRNRHETRTFIPIPERIATLCGRLKRQIRLRHLKNGDKRLTIVLHNNPCKGVEATVGMAVGLDTFQSLGRLLAALSTAGYDTGAAPFDGREILAEIQRRKAIAEFRWTTVGEIIAKGGVLQMMGRDEYQNWFCKLPASVRARVERDWGPFPGQGMTWQKNGADFLIITGLRYGNIQIINQPKRGCYGAKCNGEVCRILHDPGLAPPHHWLAAYKFIQDTSDAVIHFGTEGALEYLPGKQNGMSDCCFPDISIGTLPNLYTYVMDAVGEGLIAKRRGQAILIDHLGPVFSPAALNSELVRLDELLNQYAEAEQSADLARMAALRESMEPLLALLDLGQNAAEEDFQRAVDLARRALTAVRRRLSPESLHILGRVPDTAETGRLLAAMLRRPPAGLPDSTEIAARHEDHGAPHEPAAKILSAITASAPANIAPEQRELYDYCRRTAEGLAGCSQEIKGLLHGLDGGYIPPGSGGSLISGQIETLPTGRNFFAKDISRLPTRAAWQVGQRAAESLLLKYLDEEGRFPEQIGISIWSADAFKSDGELFCQILCLMGTRPQWDKQGKCTGITLIPLPRLILSRRGNQISRPRVDVTIETSGVMRDMVPHFCDLMDQAVVLAGGLDEPPERNFIHKHIEEQMAELRSHTANKLNEAEMRRAASCRVFSQPPGTYGSGIGLALDASAWDTDQDLAEVYINWNGYSYGGGREGVAACNMLAKQIGRLDISYMKQASEEYDILDCGCYAVSQGGMATTARALSGREVKLYWAEAGAGAELSGVKEQLLRSAHSRLLNRAWIKGVKSHGYQGAMMVSSRVNNLFKWSAASHAVPKTLFDQVAATYIQDKENHDWLSRENPCAMEEISRRLLEAAVRGLWQADSETLRAVQNAALEVEGDMEEIMGEVQEDFQGNKVEIIKADDVDKWHLKWRFTKT